jgi:eukaryotic-like serine/threonine-protein kinase
VIGKTISHYKILEKLGQGGMGVVYKAEDTKLDRIVALKFLPQHVTANDSDKARFLQEAKAASAINHPNVCVIYDIQEVDDNEFIIMEYVDGETLGQKIKFGQMPLKDVTNYAIQIAEALQAAHKNGIIHRDIKSENIMVNSDNQIKVMDFGLAKLKGSLKLTKNSSTVGTLFYMAPEQIEGSTVDARSDIFSFGVVLYEMLSRHLPFRGEYESAMMYSILNEEPESIQKYRTDLSSEYLHILNRSLEKDPEDRYQNAHDIAIDLKRVLRDSDRVSRKSVSHLSKQEYVNPAKNVEKPKSKKSKVLLFGTVFTVIALAIVATLFFNPFSQKQQNNMTMKKITSYKGWEGGPKLSPNGNNIAFNWMGNIYVKQVGGTGELQLTNTNDQDWSSDWSPDGNQIIFARHSEDENECGIFIIPVLGTPGSERKIISLTWHYWFNPSWSPDGQYIVFSDQDSSRSAWALYSFNTQTYHRSQITHPPMDADDSYTAISPNGEKLAFVRKLPKNNSIIVKNWSNRKERTVISNFGYIHGLTWSRDSKEIVFHSRRSGSSQLWRISEKGGEPKLVAEAGLSARYPTISKSANRLAFEQPKDEVSIWKAKLNEKHTIATNAYQFITHEMRVDYPSISPYSHQISFRSRKAGELQMWFCDSTGQNITQATYLKADYVFQPQWSPNADSISFVAFSEGQTDIYIMDTKTKRVKTITSKPSDERWPQWSRNGHWIYFSSNRTGVWEAFRVSKNGGIPTQLTNGRARNMQETWDGKNLIFYRDNCLWMMPISSGDEIKLFTAKNMKVNFVVSKDGIYYITAVQNQNDDPIYDIDFFNFKNSSVTRILRESTGKINNISISPAGDYILYSVWKADVDIWMIENWR